MTEDELQTRVAQVLSRVIEETMGEAPDLERDTALITSGILDSLSMMQLFVELQSEFEIDLEGDVLTEENFNTVEAISGVVQSYIER